MQKFQCYFNVILKAQAPQLNQISHFVDGKKRKRKKIMVVIGAIRRKDRG